MSDIESIKNRLQHEGYAVIHEYNDPAHGHFSDHTHTTNQLLVVVRGSLSANMDGQDFVLRAGDEFFFPALKVHNVTMGPEGCFYLVGEKS